MLADSKTCQACGKCCKEYWWCEGNAEVAGRFAELVGINSLVELRQRGDISFYLVTINRPCMHLEECKGKYSCNIYKDRPNMCKQFPDNVPISYFKALQDKCPIMAKTLKELKK